MPLLLLLGGGALLGIVGTATGAGVANSTNHSTTTPPAGGINQLPAVLYWPLVIGGTVLAVKYGSKLLKNV